MKRIISVLAAISVSAAMFAQTPIKLYDGPAPGSESWDWPEVELDYWSPIWNEQNTCILNVTEPVVLPFIPAPGTANGSAIVVCPGGGYSALSWNNEGPQVAQWLAAHGITAFVLKYRIECSGLTVEDATCVGMHTYGGQSRRDPEYVEIANKNREFNKTIGDVREFASADGRKAIEYVRTHAEEYGIDPNKIGIVGFSAGSAIAVDILYDHTELSKPNFVGLMYCAMAKDHTELPAEPCPLFVGATQNEIAGLSYNLYDMWCKKRLPAEIHSFYKANHGFGYRNNGTGEDLWAQMFYNFLKKNDIVK